MITGGSDYNIILDDEVTITVGSVINSRQDIMNIFIIDDDNVEGDETFTMTLTPVPGPGNPQINPQFSVATVTIIDKECKYLKINQYNFPLSMKAVTASPVSSVMARPVLVAIIKPVRICSGLCELV